MDRGPRFSAKLLSTGASSCAERPKSCPFFLAELACMPHVLAARSIIAILTVLARLYFVTPRVLTSPIRRRIFGSYGKESHRKRENQRADRNGNRCRVGKKARRRLY